MEVASTHLYHAVSLIRAFLGVDMDPVVVNARTFTAPLADPLTFARLADGPDARAQDHHHRHARLRRGRMGLYNFVDNQWWNPLLAAPHRHPRFARRDRRRHRHPAHRPEGPVTSPIVYRRTGVDMNLEGNEVVHASFDGRVIYRNPWVGTSLSEDDIAVASHLAAIGMWARDEAAGPYPLAQGCQDHALGLAIEQSARTGADVNVEMEVWA